MRVMRALLLGVLAVSGSSAALAFAPYAAPLPTAGWAAGFTSPVTCGRRQAGATCALRMQAVAGKRSSKSKLLKAIKKPKGTIAIMAAIKRKDPGNPELTFPIPSIRDLSQSLNDAKVQSIAVWVDQEEYGTSMDDLTEVITAQAKFKGNFPGPAPVLMLSKAADEKAIEAAAAIGAAGVLLSATTADTGALAGAVSACADAGMEPVVLCQDQEQMQRALTAGAKVLAVDSKKLGLDASLALADSCQGSEVLMAMGGIRELEDAWKLRDAGFGCIVVGEELMAATYGRPGEVRQGGGKEGLSASVCLGDTIRQNDINTFIKALGAKASVKFGPTGVNSFREKGAKSYRYYVVE